MATIIVVGLGPGERRLLTLEALETLRAARHVYLRTARHPIVDELAGDLRPDARVRAFDDLYESAASFDEVYAHIVTALLAAATAAGDSAGDPVYAVPGHPLVGEASVRLLLDKADAHGVAVRIVDGLSFLEPAFAALRLDPLAAGLHIVDALEASRREATRHEAATGLQDLWAGPSSRLLNAQAPLLVGQVYDARTRSRVKLWLLERYPAQHPVTLVRAAGTAAARTDTLPLAELDHVAHESGDGEDAPHLTSLYVPPLAPLDDPRSPNTLGYITARLRAPGGCPWDREQTPASLTPYMIEEAYEAVDAIERADDADTVEELGDVLLQVVLHSQLAEEDGRFALADVAEEVNRKLVRRHPHVFGDVTVSGSSEVLRNWESIKRVEKGERRTSVLDGVPPALPALLLAQTVGRKAAKVGFDWSDVGGTLAKVREELDEIAGAENQDERRDEVGDLLFALTSVCRHLDIDAEGALRGAVRKFEERFRHVEAIARDRGLDLTALDLEGLETLWQEAKATP